MSLSSQVLSIFMFSTVISFLFIMNVEETNELYSEFVTHTFLNVIVYIYSAEKNISSSLKPRKHMVLTFSY